ncbi:MAG: hypothetical protein COA78_10790 [Blastopirellula sp.]|nr:MAG: hypothetical protein COA78_10790 [Blastopirellula sp.]
MPNALISSSTADDSGVGCASGSNAFGTSSVWPQAIRGYRGKIHRIQMGVFIRMRLLALYEANGNRSNLQSTAVDPGVVLNKRV